MIRTYKTKNGETRHQVRVKDKLGRNFPSKTFDNLADANAYLRYLNSEKDKGKKSRGGLVNNISFEAFCGEWKLESRSNVSKGWQISQDQMIRDYILPHIGKLRLKDVTPRDIASTLRSAQSAGRSPQTLRHVYNLLHKMFVDAVEHFEYLDLSPVKRKHSPAVPTQPRNHLNPQQSCRLIECAKASFLESAVLLGLLAGLRPGEIQALKWSSVDFATKTISIRATFQKKLNLLQPFPKQKSAGEVIMATPLLKFLEQAALVRKSEFVAPGENGAMLNYNVFNRKLKKLCAEARVPIITPHELRHSCTLLWVLHGATKEDCRRLLNQKSGTIDRYMHHDSARLQAIGESFAIEAKPRLNLVR